jgi:hypothetical protein
MAIPESQLETWSHQGAVATAKATHISIRTALAANTSPLLGKDYEVYPQGSYKNDTNIRGESDVDVVVQLNATFGYDLTGLSQTQAQLFHVAYPSNGTYLGGQSRDDILQALRAYYGRAAVTEGAKSLKLARAQGKLGADIIPAIQLRKYQYFYGIDAQQYVEGIRFHSHRNGWQIVNFPKLHYDNGVAKNAQGRTNGRYKPAVRMFKNARTYLVDRSAIAKDAAPSYFLESLIYNAPDSLFSGNRQEMFMNVGNYLYGLQPDRAICQNEQMPLFGSTPEQWDAPKAGQFLNALRDLWNNW